MNSRIQGLDAKSKTSKS